MKKLISIVFAALLLAAVTPVFAAPDAQNYVLELLVMKLTDGSTPVSPAELGLSADEVKEVLPAFAENTSRFHDAVFVRLVDGSREAAEQALTRAIASDAVTGGELTEETRMLEKLRESYAVLAGLDPKAVGDEPDLLSLGGEAVNEAKILFRAGDTLIAEFFLKDPCETETEKLIAHLKAQPGVRYAEKNGVMFLDEFLVGDADCDGEVTAADARLILRFAVGLENPRFAYAAWVADCDRRGGIDAGDARHALRVAVGLEPAEHVW